jgi:hypothetical protein
LSAARIVVRYEDKRSLKTGPSQTVEAFIHQSLAESGSLVNRINGQMINISAASVVTAQCDANNRSGVGGDPAQPRIPREKVGNAFAVVTFRNLETFNSSPQLKCGVVIADGKFSRSDLALHLGCKNPNLLRRGGARWNKIFGLVESKSLSQLVTEQQKIDAHL